ncbi:Thioredoxin [Nymphon striatum]|nr:Thioredoxin [Nymphon striatum]
MAPSLDKILDSEQRKQNRILLYFMAPHCGMCRHVTPIIDELSNQRNDVKRVDISINADVAKELGVLGTPAFVLIENGVIDKVKLGALPKDKILEMLAVLIMGNKGMLKGIGAGNAYKFLSVLLMTILLSACGGGSGDKSAVSDTTAPQAPSNPTVNIVSGGKIQIKGTAEANSIVKATFSDASNVLTTVQTTVASDGTFTLTSPNSINGGTVTLTATDSSGNVSTKTSATIPAPTNKNGSLIAQLPLTKPISGVKYTTSFYNGTGTTGGNGSYTYKEGETDVVFTIAGKEYSVDPSTKTNLEDLLGSNTNNTDISHLKYILTNLDKDNNSDNGFDLSGDTANNADIDPATTHKEITKKLYKATGKHPEQIFSPSLGINTEAPQAEADTAGQAMPFVDIFKTARPFKELSKLNTQETSDAEFDENGWQTKMDSVQGYGRTKLLQGTLKGAIPSGKYTLLYEGNGKLELGGKNISQVTGLSNHKGFSFQFSPQELDFSNFGAEEENVLNLNVKEISPGEGNYIKNIRIIIPGGTCKHSDGKHNPFIRVESQSDCPSNTSYESFVDQVADKETDDINGIIFNPDYLSFLRDFKVVRMMNMMESSHGTSSCAVSNDGVTEIDTECVNEAVDWSDRAKISDAVWGGSGRTDHTDRNGVPVEVIVALANLLQRDMWVNMPHYADDEFIGSFADYVSNNLDQSLKTYIEYSNETWNPGFLGHFYVEEKGIDAGLNTVPSEFEGFRDEEYFARLRFYSQRSVEIFNIWKEEFNGNTDRLVRVLGTNQGDKVLSEQMLKHVISEYGAGNVDAIAMAPYFFGCTQNTGSCSDAPKVLKDATTVDDVFDIVDQDVNVDPSALSGTIAKMKAQAEITSQYNVQLLSYEGGQHLTTSVMGALELSESEKSSFRELFKEANRDPRMKDRYETLLNAWKNFEDQGASLFTMYTLPQSYYRFGNWGLKEHLNKSRKDSPKFDGVMTFQESIGKCWWVGCNN